MVTIKIKLNVSHVQLLHPDMSEMDSMELLLNLENEFEDACIIACEDLIQSYDKDVYDG